MNSDELKAKIVNCINHVYSSEGAIEDIKKEVKRLIDEYLESNNKHFGYRPDLIVIDDMEIEKKQ